MSKRHSLLTQLELVKETHYTFEGIEPKIIGRVYKIIEGANAQYQWDTNYYYRLEDQAMPYISSAIFGSTKEEAVHRLEQYVKNFEKAAEWIKNDYF